MVKGAAVNLLLWHHLFSAEGDITGNNIRLHFLSVHQLANSGIASRVCVWLFIFISAYGWTLQFRPSAADTGLNRVRYSMLFVKNRWLKLMIPFWSAYPVFLCLSFVLFKYAVRRYAAHPFLYAVLDFSALADFFHTPMLAGIWWYMGFAQLMLLTVPFVIFLAEKTGLFSALLVFTLSRTIGENLIISRYGYKYSAYTMIVVFGVLAAKYDVFQRIGNRIRTFCQNHPAREFLMKNALWVCFAAPAMVMLFLIYKYLYAADKGTVYGMMMETAALLLTEAACFFPERVSGPLLFSGKFSGDIFLAHGFILVQFRNVIYGTRNVFAAWGLLMAGSLVLCAVLYAVRAGERKLISFLSRRIRRGFTAVAEGNKDE